MLTRLRDYVKETLAARFFVLAFTLTLAGGLLCLLPLALLIQTQQEQQARQNMEENLRMQTAFVSNWSNELSRSINFFSELPEASKQDKTDFYEKIDFLFDHRSDFYDLFYADANGDIVYKTNEASLTRKINVASTSYFQKALKSHSAVSGVRLIGETNERAVIFSAPLTDENGRFGGVLAGVLLTDSLRHLVGDFGYGKTGQVFLADRSGHMLSASESPFPLSLKNKDIFKKATQQKSGTYSYTNSSGTVVFGSYKWINQDQWLLISEITKAELTEPFRDMAWIFGFMGAALFGFAFFIARKLTREAAVPARVLLEGTAILQNGHYDHRIDASAMKKFAREFQVLCQAYNNMAANLQNEQALRKQAEREMKQANEVLRFLSLQDGLTGIKNRRFFDETLDELWKQAGQSQKPLTLLLIDIDFFKPYNDRYGHDAGDQMLKQIAGTVDFAAHKHGGLAARYGGEELAVLLPNPAPSLAQDILQKVKELRLPHFQSPSGFLTVSIGSATMVPQPDTSPRLLIQHADRALYQSKKRGRNRATSAKLELFKE